MLIKVMNSEHAKMAAWGMGHLIKLALDQIVYIGCGGKNAGELMKNILRQK